MALFWNTAVFTYCLNYKPQFFLHLFAARMFLQSHAIRELQDESTALLSYNLSPRRVVNALGANLHIFFLQSLALTNLAFHLQGI